MSDQPSTIDRRLFLSGTLAAAVLTACGKSAPTNNTTAATEGVKLPTYVRYTGVKPDLPGNEQGLLDGFLQYPTPQIKAFPTPPGDGGPVSAFVQTNSPVPPALAQNPFWQELNKRMNVDLKLTIVPTADMGTKFATLIAGDDLPDIIEPALFLPNGMPAGVTWIAGTISCMNSATCVTLIGISQESPVPSRRKNGCSCACTTYSFVCTER